LDSSIGNGVDSFSSLDFQTLDLQTTRSVLQDINVVAAAATRTLSTGFANATVSGKSFDATLGAIAQSLARLGAGAGAQLLTQSAVSGLGALFAGAFGGGGGTVAPFAEGGVVASPTFFGAGGSVGLMGERGAEAIVPLARGPDGQLGLKAQGGGAPISVTVNVTAQDMDSFRRSEGQIAAALARAVARGRRNL
jgi:phage-related minor tail protein